MVKALQVPEWVSLLKQLGTTPKRDGFVGVSLTLAARLLGVVFLVGALKVAHGMVFILENSV